MPLWLRATLTTALFPGMVAGVLPVLIARGGWGSFPSPPARQFGERFDRYLRSVPRWMPRVPPRTS